MMNGFSGVPKDFWAGGRGLATEIFNERRLQSKFYRQAIELPMVLAIVDDQQVILKL